MSEDTAQFRSVRMGQMAVEMNRGSGGEVRVKSTEELGEYPRAIVDAIKAWAEKTPDAIMIADRDGDGWRELTYKQVVDQIPPIAQALLDADLSVDRPLLVLSGNEIEHMLIGLAAMWVGIPYAPISPAYSLVSTDFGKLRHIVDLLTPGMVYASDGKAFGAAVKATIGDDIPLVVRTNPPEDRDATLFSDLVASKVTDAVAQAHAAITPDTIAKFLFTSGSTGMPKGVITTNKMMAVNQAMIRNALAFLADEPPVLLDWMPWNHVAGGSHNTGIAFYNGGSFYIDDGQPTPARIGKTLRNLTDVRPTFYANVPKGYEFLVDAFENDTELRSAFFSRLKLLQYAGANLSQHVFEGLDRAARAVSGDRIMIITGYGSTETAPFAFTTTWPVERSGHIGLPAAGMEIKLIPNGDKTELRLKGPNVTPGYWRDEKKTGEAFDEDGFYMIGDAVKFADPDDITKGFLFDGRVSEDFKLSTGTWVNFAAVRNSVISACAPLIRDVVLTGQDENFIGAMIFPDMAACAKLAGLPADADPAQVVGNPKVVAAFTDKLSDLAHKATGSSNHVARAVVLTDAPDIDKGEVTDKGSINQRAVTSARKDIAQAIHENPAPEGVMAFPRKAR